jgi:hypothetical protein
MNVSPEAGVGCGPIRFDEGRFEDGVFDDGVFEDDLGVERLFPEPACFPEPPEAFRGGVLFESRTSGPSPD